MTTQIDEPATSGTRPRPTRPWLAPLLVNAALTVLLGLLVLGVFCTLIAETPLALLVKWYHAVVVIVLSAIVAAAAFFLGLSRRRLWFAGLFPVVAWILMTLLVFASFTPFDDYQGFILDCARIEKGDSVDKFEAYMAKRGWRSSEGAWYDTPSEGSPAGFSPGGAEAFLVYFDMETREITHWRFIHD